MSGPTVENFKYILRQNIIQNCPVTVEDVNIAKKIFGPDMGTLKGKTTRKKPKPVKSDTVEIPPETTKEKHSEVTLCMDLMYVNGMPMFTSIDKSIRYRSVVSMENRTSAKLFKALDQVFRLYNKAKYNDTTIQ